MHIRKAIVEDNIRLTEILNQAIVAGNASPSWTLVNPRSVWIGYRNTWAIHRRICRRSRWESCRLVESEPVPQRQAGIQTPCRDHLLY